MAGCDDAGNTRQTVTHCCIATYLAEGPAAAARRFAVGSGNAKGTEGSAAEARPACTHACLVSSDPATVEAAAIRRRRRDRSLPELPAINRRIKGTGPDRIPPRRVSQPLLPLFSGATAFLLSFSPDTPTSVSVSAEAMPSEFSAG